MSKEHDVRVIKILKSIVGLLNIYHNENVMFVFYVKYSVNAFQKILFKMQKTKGKCGDYEELPPKYSLNGNKILYIFIKIII